MTYTYQILRTQTTFPLSTANHLSHPVAASCSQLNLTTDPNSLRLLPKYNTLELELSHMALVSGPGRGGLSGVGDAFPQEGTLVVEKHVDYIRNLDTVRQTSAGSFR